MGRFAGWTLGVIFALAISVAPAAAQGWSVGVHIGNGPVYGGPVYYPPVYRAPVYRVPAYDPYYDPYYYDSYYDPYYYRPVYRSYRPVYRDRVVVVGGGRYDTRYYGRNDRGRSYDRGRGYDRDRGRSRGRR